MEEKKIVKMTPKHNAESKEEVKKVSYEQLKNYVDQLQAKGRELYEENQRLRQAIEDISRDRTFKEIDCIFQCLDRKDMFSEEFLKKVTNKLEEIFTPDTEDKEEPKEEK